MTTDLDHTLDSIRQRMAKRHEARVLALCATHTERELAEMVLKLRIDLVWALDDAEASA